LTALKSVRVKALPAKTFASERNFSTLRRSIYSIQLSLLQKELCTGDFLRREAKAEGAGGHFWHDAVTKPNIITPAP
jgi:hypothetical protein